MHHMRPGPCYGDAGDPDVAPQAVVIANTENVAKRKHFAKGVVDGMIGSRTATS